MKMNTTLVWTLIPRCRHHRQKDTSRKPGPSRGWKLVARPTTSESFLQRGYVPSDVNASASAEGGPAGIRHLAAMTCLRHRRVACPQRCFSPLLHGCNELATGTQVLRAGHQERGMWSPVVATSCSANEHCVGLRGM